MSNLTNGLSKHDYNEQSNKISRRKTSVNRHSNKANKISGIMLYTVRDSVFFVCEGAICIFGSTPSPNGRQGGCLSIILVFVFLSRSKANAGRVFFVYELLI